VSRTSATAMVYLFVIEFRVGPIQIAEAKRPEHETWF
jgi:hypothetical protein